MKKRFITLFLCGLMTFGLSSCTAAQTSYTVTYNGETYSYDDISKLEDLIEAQINIMNAAHDMAEAGRKLGYEESHRIIATAKNEYVTAEIAMHDIRVVIADLKEQFNTSFNKKASEYPNAAKVWKYFKDQGYSNEVCAGIMGNLMTEVGGQTLALNPYASNGKYYGICQWNNAYTEVWGTDLMTQCEFLNKTMKYEFDTFGKKYKNNFNFEDFKNLKDEEDVALAFAKCYERCGSDSYKVRQKNAKTAYQYFVN